MNSARQGIWQHYSMGRGWNYCQRLCHCLLDEVIGKMELCILFTMDIVCHGIYQFADGDPNLPFPHFVSRGYMPILNSRHYSRNNISATISGYEQRVKFWQCNFTALSRPVNPGSIDDDWLSCGGWGFADVSGGICCYFRVSDLLICMLPLQWRHNERDSIPNDRRLHCLLNFWFRRRSKKTSKLCVTGLCVGNSPVTGEFPAQKASNAENVWWCRHGYLCGETPTTK